MDAVTAIVSITGGVLASGGMSSIITALARRRSDRAEVARKLTDAAMRQVDQLQERVTEAEKVARELRQDAEDARQQLRFVRREAADLAERISAMARWVHDPYMTLDRLRHLVPAPPGGGPEANGTQPSVPV